MNHGHSITKCCKCETVITQCRCMSKDKIVKWDVCNKCVKELVVNYVTTFKLERVGE